ncbi:restriction endonuclease [Streptomyces longwoodensis]|uniref:restriction endonuclease n=1 Tax=Streptomyces longwoodensis TaxID=68231 RepID=UPI00384BF5E4
MIIDRNARVTPSRYPDRDLRKMMGDALGKADQADLLAAYLWVQEIRIGREACNALRKQRDSLRTSLTKLEKYKGDSQFRGRTWNFTRAELTAVLDAFIKMANDELNLIERCLQQASLAFEELSTPLEEDLSTRYSPGRIDSPLNTIATQWDEVAPSTDRFEAMNHRALAETDCLADVDDRRNLFAQSEKSYSMQRIQEFDSKNFEILIAWLTHRDGMKVIRQHGGSGDRGADVISQTPDGRRVVVQCKQTSRGVKQMVTSTNVQTFNGTARLEHKADIALMVTNGTYSEPARDFANDHTIHLIGGTELERWATWGDSLYEVLGISQRATNETPT